jgi:hypothetical protein
VNDESAVFAFLAEVCYSGDPFEVLIEERRRGEIRRVRRGEGTTAPYSGHGDSGGTAREDGGGLK